MNLGGIILSTTVGHRKKRSDAKRDVKPTIKLPLRESVCRMADITDNPIKDVGANMIEHAVKNKKIIDSLSIHFRRDILIENTIKRGSTDNPRIAKREDGIHERITIRLRQHTYEMVSALAFALDVSVSRACAILIEKSMHDFDFVNNYVKKHLKSHLTPNEMRSLESLLHYVNQGIEYGEKVTLAGVVSYIVEEAKAPISKAKEAISNFVINRWNDNFK
ncbi:hypothetical protein A9986_13945 [Solibacillus silvestris]|nr:hypothetical protein A9986_13945 [Solibacillus silvestris]